MFTGIIEEVGTVGGIQKGANSSVISINGNMIFGGMKLGDSIAVNGVCLTVSRMSGKAFTADVMHETLNRSSLGALRAGSRVNLERAMAADGRFGGHFVTGHIDGTGTVAAITQDDNAVLYTIKTTEKVLKYIVEKGSVAIDGISLTVTAVTAESFGVSIIPHTSSVTILSEKRVGDVVNLENDVIGKYVEKLMNYATDDVSATSSGGITLAFLAENGF